MKRHWTVCPRTVVTGALLLLAAVASTPVQAGRFAAMGAVCPADVPDKKLDANGTEDACVAQAAATCAPDQRLVRDAAGEKDRCVADGAPAESGEKPSCPSGFDLEVKADGDVCERSVKPACRRGHLTARVREDVCQF